MSHARDEHVEGNDDRFYPASLICPIAYAPFTDPCLAMDMHSYDRDLLAEHFSRSNISPATGQHLVDKRYFPNFTVKKIVDDFKEIILPKLKRLEILEEMKIECIIEENRHLKQVNTQLMRETGRLRGLEQEFKRINAENTKLKNEMKKAQATIQDYQQQDNDLKKSFEELKKYCALEQNLKRQFMEEWKKQEIKLANLQKLADGVKAQNVENAELRQQVANLQQIAAQQQKRFEHLSQLQQEKLAEVTAQRDNFNQAGWALQQKAFRQAITLEELKKNYQALQDELLALKAQQQKPNSSEEKLRQGIASLLANATAAAPVQSGSFAPASSRLSGLENAFSTVSINSNASLFSQIRDSQSPSGSDTDTPINKVKTFQR